MAKFYCCGIAPFQSLAQYGVFTDRKECAERAKMENKSGSNKGRGVRVYPCDENGRITPK